MNYLTRSTDRKNLLLPDGRRADQLRIRPLWQELNRLGTPGINATMGKDALLDRYAAQIATVAETLPRSGMKPRDLSATVAKQAAALIANQAAGFDTSALATPAAPIASMRV